MGNSSSANDKCYALTPHILTLLKPFGVFKNFPNDKIEADQIISNAATNALKSVSSSFSDRLGGHNKRKRQSSSEILPSIIQN